MNLEVISRRPAGRQREPAILFVHGTNSGAWVWAEHFLPYFCERGYSVCALSLRGHGASEGRETLAWHGLGDYETDLITVARTFEVPPVLIGHSMGGLVVQRCLERLLPPGVVLMASLPPSGLGPVLTRMMALDPAFCQRVTAVQSLWDAAPDAAETVREMLFADPRPAPWMEAYLARWQRESPRAVAELMMAPWWPLPYFMSARPAVPMLVMGAASDRLVAPEFVETTAHYYRTSAEILPNMGHAMMLEPNWRSAADRILDWLTARF